MAYLPVESVIRDQQIDYYRVLGETDQASDCTVFIEFMLNALAQALNTSIESALPPVAAGEMAVQLAGKTEHTLILALQQAPELTVAQLAAQIGVSRRTIERQLQKLQRLGVISRVGANKGGYWQVISSSV